MKSTLPKPAKPVLKSGIVFYVYSPNQCHNNSLYMDQVKINARFIKDTDPSISIALMTNCDIPVETVQYLDVIGPIHNNDVMKTSAKQWRTRMLYNAYLPFYYSYIIDSHIFPCDNKAPREILDLFEKSQIDVSFSNRQNKKGCVSGGAALSHWSEGSFEFWKRVYLLMNKKNFMDDQTPMSIIVRSDWSKKYKYRWLSSNWFFASHGINENAIFRGPATCYRSSIIITGPVRWIHGNIHDCVVMNKLPNLPRCYFKSGTCNTTGIGNYAIYSEQELKRNVYPYEAPELAWYNNSRKDKTSLFW